MAHKVVKFVNQSNNPNPSRATSGSSGVDLAAAEEVIINPGETKIVKTGIFVEIRLGFEGQIRSRSGMAAKHTVHVLNSPGTIDSDYRDELKVILHNSGKTMYKIEYGDRIAQMVIAPVDMSAWEELMYLEDLSQPSEIEGTPTRSGGFGHTGK